MRSISNIVLIITFLSTYAIVLATNQTKSDLWMVYDSEVDDSQSSPHKVPPSCILASMKAKIDIFGSKYGKSLLPSTSYDLFQTNETRAENLTCGSVGEDSGDPEQKLILKWHPDSEMVFFFRKKNEFNILHHVVLRMLIPLDDKEESYYELLAESAWDLEMMRAPTLFAFVCTKPVLIPMEAKVSKIMTTDNAPLLSDGQLSTPMSVTYNATLELTDVMVELFRIKRYYNNFTHLKYDCVVGWPYQWVAHTILVIALVLAVTLFVNFTSRFLKSTQSEYNHDI